MLRPAHPRRPRRPGKILVLFCVMLTLLLGMLGLTLDGGTMMAAHRQTQNAADAAALAAAAELMRGSTAATAKAAATTFVQTHNGLAGATVTVNIPPTGGPKTGNSQFAEVIVSRPYSTVFAHANGADQDQTVVARAVAGFEPVASGEGAIVLDPRAVRSGLTFNGTNTRLKVKGTVVVNNGGSGKNQWGDTITTNLGTTKQPAITTSNVVANPTQAYVQARAVEVRGGVDTPLNFRDYDDPTNGPSPLYAGAGMSPDPLRLLPVPVVKNTYASPTSTTATGTIPAVYPAQSVGNGDTKTFNPGVYESINITGGTAIFRSGVYVFVPSQNNQGLRISGGTTTSQSGGVMFYFGASNYLSDPANPGSLDIADGAFDGPLPPTNGSYTLPSDANGVKLSTLDINGSSGSVNLDGFAYNSALPSDRILFFARRRNQDPNGNTSLYNVGGSGSSNMVLGFKGTIYSKWASFSLGGGGTYDAQFIVGSLALSGGATMTINGTGINRGLADQVYLTE